VEGDSVIEAPRVSVVTPSYNQGRYIEQTIRSVLAQAAPVEHIVMDGASSDETVAILRKYSDVVRWSSGPDRGQTDALNKGFSLVRGEIVGWINSDDFYLPGAIGHVLSRFDAPDRPDVVFGYTVEVDPAGRPLREHRHDEFSLETLLQLGLDVTQQALFWRREMLERVLPLSESLRFCMDVELVARLAATKARFALCPRFLGAFRIHPAAKSSTIQDVGVREYELLRERALAALDGARLRSRNAIVLRRRIRFLRRGDWRYAVLGGRLGLSAEAVEAVAAARAWS
jgi:glycosyltransferase involved in cell wall biosynthesis